MRTKADPPLETFLARLADGDRSAFTPVFQQLWQPIFRLCLSTLKNDADAADAAQQAMEKIFERASDYDASRPALPWACAIASWECRTIIQRRSRRREVPEQAQSQAGDEHAEKDHVRRDLIAAALNALGELSETDRETLITTFWDEAGTVPAATFRKRRERALQRLRSAWRKLYGIE